MNEQTLVRVIEKMLEDFTAKTELLVTDISIKHLITSTNTSKSSIYRITLTVTSDL